MAVPEWQWIIGTGVYVDDVDEAVKKAVVADALLCALILAIVGVIAFFVSRSIVRQLGGEPAEAIALMSRAATGDLTVDFKSSAKGSILESAGQMTQSLRRMRGRYRREFAASFTRRRANQHGSSRSRRRLSTTSRLDASDGFGHRGNDGQRHAHLGPRK